MQGAEDWGIMLSLLWLGNNLPVAEFTDRKSLRQIQMCDEMQPSQGIITGQMGRQKRHDSRQN